MTEAPAPPELDRQDPLVLAVHEQRKQKAEDQQNEEMQRRPAQLGIWQDEPGRNHRRHLGGMIGLHHTDLLGRLGLNAQQKKAAGKTAQGVWVDGTTAALLIPRRGGQATLVTSRRDRLYQVTTNGRRRLSSAADLDLEAGIPEVQPFTRPGFLTHPDVTFIPALNRPWKPGVDEDGDSDTHVMAMMVAATIVVAYIGTMTGYALGLALTHLLHSNLPFGGVGASVGGGLAGTVVLTKMLMNQRTIFHKAAKRQQERRQQFLLPPQQQDHAALNPASRPSPFDPRF